MSWSRKLGQQLKEIKLRNYEKNQLMLVVDGHQQ